MVVGKLFEFGRVLLFGKGLTALDEVSVTNRMKSSGESRAREECIFVVSHTKSGLSGILR